MTLPEGWREMTLAEIARGGLFSDGDWVESKDQDPAGDVRLTQLADVGVGEWRDRSDRWLREDQASRLRCTFCILATSLLLECQTPLGAPVSSPST